MTIKSNQNRPKPVVLVIMDGVGGAPDSEGNAVTRANTPMLKKLWAAFPHGYLEASGEHVGLPENIRGNSEVGHTNIGAGRIVYQSLPRIDRSIENGNYFKNEAFIKAIDNAKKNKTDLHIMGLLSDGQVHSSIEHFYALLELVKKQRFKGNTYIHAFTDGRDTSPIAGLNFLTDTQERLKKIKNTHLATIIGRYFAMDRNDQWDRTQKAYELLTQGKGQKIRPENLQAEIQKAYKAEETDEYLEPKVLVDKDDQPLGTIKDGDSVIFYNYRPDRAIQISQAFVQEDFKEFDRQKLQNLTYVGMTQYTPELYMDVAFPPDDVMFPMGRIVSEAGLNQLRIAESEKYPHVTYFFNGGLDLQFPGEDRIEVRSPDVATYDEKPEMSAPEVTEMLIRKINLGVYDFIVVNYANGDMVGHTGVFDVGVKSVEAVDYSLRRLIPAVLRAGGELLITADHGNVEEMINLETGEVDTMHSLFPVPVVHVSKAPKQYQMELGILADLSPTLCHMLGIEPHESMSGKNLLRP